MLMSQSLPAMESSEVPENGLENRLLKNLLFKGLTVFEDGGKKGKKESQATSYNWPGTVLMNTDRMKWDTR